MPNIQRKNWNPIRIEYTAMGQACVRDKAEEQNHEESRDDEEQVDMNPKSQGEGQVKFKDGLNEDEDGCRNETKKIKKRKPTGKKIKKKSKVNLEIVNKNFEISQTYTDPNSEAEQNGKASKVRFNSGHHS
jgi:hypothetical protein